MIEDLSVVARARAVVIHPPEYFSVGALFEAAAGWVDTLDGATIFASHGEASVAAAVLCEASATHCFAVVLGGAERRRVALRRMVNARLTEGSVRGMRRVRTVRRVRPEDAYAVLEARGLA